MYKISLFSVKTTEEKLVEDLRKKIKYEIDKKMGTKEEILEKYKLKKVIFLKQGKIITEHTMELYFEGSVDYMKYEFFLDTRYMIPTLTYCKLEGNKIIFSTPISFEGITEKSLEIQYQSFYNDFINPLSQFNNHIKNINEKLI